MRILITGSRDWGDGPKDGLDELQIIYTALADAVAGIPNSERVTVVHGGAHGADVIAAYGAHMLGFYAEAHRANWDDCGNDCGPTHYRFRGDKPYCPRAGFVRNAKMVELGADVCLAFIKNNSKGATMAADLAQKAGIPVWRYSINNGSLVTTFNNKEQD